MAEHSLRGTGLGSHSMQSEDGVQFSPRQRASYRTRDGKTFSVVFAAEAEIPEVWREPHTGVQGHLLDASGQSASEVPDEEKITRSHWDMLRERRTIVELEEILQERLSYLRQRRGIVLATHGVSAKATGRPNQGA